jgi:hypothetical protein
MAYQTGASQGSISGNAYGDDGKHLYFGARTSQQSGLAARTAPPGRPNTFVYGCLGIGLTFVGWLCAGFVGAAFGSLLMSLLPAALSGIAMLLVPAVILGGTLLVGVAVALPLTQRYNKNLAAYKEQLTVWQRCWVCRRCGATWQV